MFIKKLCAERWRKCAEVTLFLRNSLTHSTMYLSRGIVLSHVRLWLVYRVYAATKKREFDIRFKIICWILGA